MKYTTESYKYLFEKIKDGDCFETYHNQWFYLLSKLISFISGEKVSHAMSIFDVVKDNYFVKFTIAEMVVPKKKWETCIIIKNKNEKGCWYEAIGSKFNNKHLDLYYIELDRELTKTQKEKFMEYHLKPKEYNFSEYAITQNWFSKIFADKNKSYGNVCSSDVFMGLKEIGIVDEKFDDISPDPVELLRCSFFNKITKIESK